jgi:ketosteroid isomerase-like protein
MSQENVEIVMRAIDAANRGDLESFAKHLAPDIDWHDQPELPGARIHHGHDGVLGHLRSASEDLADYHVEVKAVRELLDQVMVRAVVNARGRLSGVAVKRQTFTVFTLGGAWITRVEIFGSEAEALEAVGLPEQDAHPDS